MCHDIKPSKFPETEKNENPRIRLISETENDKIKDIVKKFLARSCETDAIKTLPATITAYGKSPIKSS